MSIRNARDIADILRRLEELEKVVERLSGNITAMMKRPVGRPRKENSETN